MVIPVQQSEQASWIQPPQGILSLTVSGVPLPERSLRALAVSIAPHEPTPRCMSELGHGWLSLHSVTSVPCRPFIYATFSPDSLPLRRVC